MSAAAVILALLIGPSFLSVARDLPFGPHDWKQSDCLSVAQRFLDDGSWNIFDPRMLTLFPVDSRVNLEFPLAPYLAAISARALGPDELPEMLRLITLVLSMLGPLALFALVWTQTRSFIAGLLPMVFVAASPVLMYYATNSLADGPGLGLALAGVALVLAGATGSSPRRIVLGIAVMTLAGLVKMSFAPYLLIPAVLVVKRRRKGPVVSTLFELPRGPVIALAVSAAILLAEVVELKHRAAVFAPTFCAADTHPFASIGQMADVVCSMSRNWLGDLFSVPQLVVLAAALALVVVSMFTDRPPDDFATATAVAAGVMVALFVLFGNVLAFHDYYGIAMFYPLAGLLVVRLTLSLWAWSTRADGVLRRSGVKLVLLAAAIAVALPVNAAFRQRTSPWWRAQNEWLREARRDLDACGERCAGPVAVIGSMPPNLALVYLGRQGYSIGFTVETALTPARFASFEDGVRFLDAHGVRVLVLHRQDKGLVPENLLDRYFTMVDATGESDVFVRRTS